MKSNRLFDRVLAASVQGIRANPKMRSVTPETLARYANEDARAVLDYAREPELSPLITANLDHKRRIAELDAELVEARRNVEAARSQTSNIASRLASVLWTLPGSTIRIEEGHMSLLTGRSWEVEQKPAGPGAYTLTLLVGPKDGPPPLRPVPAPQREDEEDPELPQPPVKADA